jgi:uncharacterized membrane protein YfcA
LEILVLALTALAGVAMGAINNVAGGAGVLALLAFVHLHGMPLPLANASSRVAAVAIGTFSFLGFLRAGRRPPPRAWLQGLLAVPGSLLGSALALELPDLAFRSYLAAMLVLLLRQQLKPAPPSEPAPRPAWLAALGCFLIGLHMGFAQIGTGLVATLVLASAYRRDLIAVNMAKSTVVITTALASVGTFAWHGNIVWAPALVLAAGAAVGSYLASHWSVAKGSAAIARVVVVIAVLTLLEQLWQIAIALW